MFRHNRITRLFGIDFPIVQGGMIWCSGWRLASAVSNAGALGLIGSGSMYADVLRDHIRKCRAATDRPFGVNVPLLYKHAEANLQVILDEQVTIVFTSAGNPRTWTETLKNAGVIVVHVVSSVKFAMKAEAAGVDALVCEGFEAGGHNGADETTTLCLTPLVADAVKIPVLAAGGIGGGRAMLAVMCLGADGVQIGSRFAATEEASGHAAFKDAIVRAGEGDTMLSLKQLTPVRLIKNKFFEEARRLEMGGATAEEMAAHLGKGRSRIGMFEGDLDEGELEIGQVSAQIGDILPAGEVVGRLVAEYRDALAAVGDLSGRFQ